MKTQTVNNETLAELHTVKCCNCDFTGFEEDLELIEDEENLEIDLDETYYVNVCPNCGTDSYLSDIN